MGRVWNSHWGVSKDALSLNIYLTCCTGYRKTSGYVFMSQICSSSVFYTASTSYFRKVGRLMSTAGAARLIFFFACIQLVCVFDALSEMCPRMTPLLLSVLLRPVHRCRHCQSEAHQPHRKKCVFQSQDNCTTQILRAPKQWRHRCWNLHQCLGFVKTQNKSVHPVQI